MKKGIIVSTTLLLLLVFIIAETASYFIVKKRVGEYVKISNAIAKKNNSQLISLNYNYMEPFNQNRYKGLERPIYYGDKNKKSVLFFGCSYIYGVNEKEENSIPCVINKITGRTTVNKGFPGGSIINTLIYLTDDSFYDIYKNKTVPEPEYVIYTYIHDHLERIVSPYKVFFSSKDLKYEIMPKIEYKNGEFKTVKRSSLLYPIYCLYITKAITLYWINNLDLITKREDKMFDLLCIAKKITEQKFPNSKFVVLVYRNKMDYKMSKSLTKRLRDNGFTVLDAEELAGHELGSEKWRCIDKDHPNAASFKDVSNGLIKTLGL